MNFKTFLFLLLFLIRKDLYAQTCDCPSAFTWMKNTFEQNDAGFKYVIDKKGEADYQKHSETLVQKAKTVTSASECTALMEKWLKYFRNGHIGIYLKEEGSQLSPSLSDNEIREKYKNEPVVSLNEKELKVMLSKKKNKSSVEGIWTNGIYTIGILQDKKDLNKYSAFIIKADSVYWMPGQIKAVLIQKTDSTFSGSYYMKNHSAQNTEARFIIGSRNILYLYNDYWKRLYPESIMTHEEEVEYLFAKTDKPFVKKLSDKTVYLRIPSFSGEEKKHIDSTLLANDTLITSTPNFIIDIRNGTGGSDNAYSKILPYLYTQPIRGVEVRLLSTELNALCYEKYAKETEDSSEKKNCLSIAAKMRHSQGKFISMSDKIYGIDSMEQVLPLPSRVGIICNHNNGSTDEQFLLDARQSRKVKIFGHPTGGMLDVSNVNVIDSPDGKFALAYCMSLSYRIPDFCIDGAGIQPDYFIDSAIPANGWVKYVQTMLEQ